MNSNLEDKLNTNGAFGDEFFNELKLALFNYKEDQIVSLVEQLAASDNPENKRKFKEFIRAQIYDYAILTDGPDYYYFDKTYLSFLYLISDALDIYPIEDKESAMHCLYYKFVFTPQGAWSDVCLELLHINNFRISCTDSPDIILNNSSGGEQRYKDIDDVSRQIAEKSREKDCKLLLLDLTGIYDGEEEVKTLVQAFQKYCPECRIAALGNRLNFKFISEDIVIRSFKQYLMLLQQVFDENGKTETIVFEADKDDCVVEDGRLVHFFARTEKAVIPNSVNYISDDAIKNKEAITAVEIPDSVKVIADHAFGHCRNIRELYIPDSVTEIGELAFAGCTCLKSVRLSKSLKVLSERMFMSCPNIKEIDIPDGVKEIESYCFFRAEKLEKVKIPDTVEIIGDHAFFTCKSLKEIVIPASVKEIGECAFFDCSNLEKITYLVENDITVGSVTVGSVFNGCRNVKRFEYIETIPRYYYFLPKDTELVKIDKEG